MQIKKINNDKLKIILSSNDLDKKNIDVDSFLSNPIESQNLFFEILDLAQEKYNFEINNNRTMIETISLDNNIFILTITKIKNDSYTYNNSLKIYCFNNFNDILSLYSILKHNNMNFNTSNIFKFSNKYYYLLNEENKYLENLLLEFSYPLKNCDLIIDIFNEYSFNFKK